MKLVINIPDSLYLGIKKDENQIHRGRIYEIIKNGVPLPKGHGNLIDVNTLREDFKASKKISFVERMDISCIVDHAPIIVKADTGETE